MPSRSILKTRGGCLVSVSTDFSSVFCSLLSLFGGGLWGGCLFFLLPDFAAGEGVVTAGSSVFTFVSSLKAGNGDGSSAVSVITYTRVVLGFANSKSMLPKTSLKSRSDRKYR